MSLSHRFIAAAFLAVVGVSTVAQARAQAPASPQAGASAPAGQGANMQGEDPRKFVETPPIRAFYALSVATLRPGAPPLDLKAYQAKSYALFHELGEMEAKGGGPGMVEHLKLIPEQVVAIVKDDPKVLDSFDSFVDALVGPK